MAFNKIIQLFRPSDEISKFKSVFEGFQQVLRGNNRALELIAQLEDKMGGEYIFDKNYFKASVENLSGEINRIVSGLNLISENRYTSLFARQMAIQEELNRIIEGKSIHDRGQFIIASDRVNRDLSPEVGEKSAVLGEIRQRLDLTVPEGFTVTTAGYRYFLEYNDLWPKIRSSFEQQDFSAKDSAKLFNRRIDALFAEATFPKDLEKAVSKALTSMEKSPHRSPWFAVRSSAHGEDREGRSYAGQFLSVMNCSADNVLSAYVRIP